MAASGGATGPHLFLRLTPDVFHLARDKFGAAIHIGREMPRELPKSWTYLQDAWNQFARTPLTAAIESTTTGDANSVTFTLFGDGKIPEAKKKKKKKKKNKKKIPKVDLRLPDYLDAHADKIAAIVDHFETEYESNPRTLYDKPVEYQPIKEERDRITAALRDIVSDGSTGHLPASQIYHEHVVAKGGFLQNYSGLGWERWFVSELKRIQRNPLAARASNSSITTKGQFLAKRRLMRQLGLTGIIDADMLSFVEVLSGMTGDTRNPFLLVEQWSKALSMCCSEHILLCLWL